MLRIHNRFGSMAHFPKNPTHTGKRCDRRVGEDGGRIVPRKGCGRQQVKAYKKLRNIEKKRLEGLSVTDLDKKIEGLRKEYRAVKKTIKKSRSQSAKKVR